MSVRVKNAYLRQAFVRDGTLAWPNGTDIDTVTVADAVYAAGGKPMKRGAKDLRDSALQVLATMKKVKSLDPALVKQVEDAMLEVVRSLR